MFKPVDPNKLDEFINKLNKIFNNYSGKEVKVIEDPTNKSATVAPSDPVITALSKEVENLGLYFWAVPEENKVGGPSRPPYHTVIADIGKSADGKDHIKSLSVRQLIVARP